MMEWPEWGYKGIMAKRKTLPLNIEEECKQIIDSENPGTLKG